MCSLRPLSSQIFTPQQQSKAAKVRVKTSKFKRVARWMVHPLWLFFITLLWPRARCQRCVARRIISSDWSLALRASSVAVRVHVQRANNPVLMIFLKCSYVLSTLRRMVLLTRTFLLLKFSSTFIACTRHLPYPWQLQILLGAQRR